MFITSIAYGQNREGKLDTIFKQAQKYKRTNDSLYLMTLKKGISVSKKLKNNTYTGKFYKEYGYYYRKTKKLDSAKYIYKQAQIYYLKEKDSSKYAYIFYDLGNIAKQEGNYDKAMSFFLRGVAFFEKHNSNTAIKNKLIGEFNIASLYVIMLERENAIQKFKNILKNPKAYDDKRLLTAIYTNLVGAFTAIKQNDSALVYAQKVKKITTSKRALAHLNSNIGSIYTSKKNYKNSLLYFNKSLELFKENKDTIGIIRCYNNLGTSLLEMNSLQKAEAYLLKANTLLAKTKNIYSLEYNISTLSKLYETEKNFKKAYYYKDKAVVLKDSILGIKKQKAISDIEIKYETDKIKTQRKIEKQKRIIAEVKSKQNQTYFIISLLAGFLLFTLSVFYVNRLKNKKKAELISLELSQTKKRLELEKQYRNSELKALKSQMNPHFLFNAMNSIQSLILKGKKEDAYNYLTKFATLIRENLNMSEKNFVYFDEELHLIQTYLELEKLRFSKDFDYKITGLDEIEDIKIPSMIIQPFIENAIKHGLLHREGEKILRINFKQEEVLKCTITDNGIGRIASEKINKNKVGKYASFSSGAIAKRFVLLKEYYKLDLGFEYDDLLNDKNEAIGTKVTIKIPYVVDDE